MRINNKAIYMKHKPQTLSGYIVNLLTRYKSLVSMFAIVGLIWAITNTLMPYMLKIIIDKAVGLDGARSTFFHVIQPYVLFYLAKMYRLQATPENKYMLNSFEYIERCIESEDTPDSATYFLKYEICKSLKKFSEAQKALQIAKEIKKIATMMLILKCIFYRQAKCLNQVPPIEWC